MEKQDLSSREIVELARIHDTWAEGRVDHISPVWRELATQAFAQGK